jgi:hypothetical protein
VAVALDGQHFVCTRAGAAVNGDCAFIFFKPITLSSVLSSVGSTAGGLRVTVVGVNLLDLELARCRFGAVKVPLDVSSPTAGACTTPAHAAGAVSFAITMNDKDFLPLPSGFLFYEPVAVSSFLPRGSPLDGGSVVTVAGARFRAFEGVAPLCRSVRTPARPEVLPGGPHTRPHAPVAGLLRVFTRPSPALCADSARRSCARRSAHPPRSCAARRPRRRAPQGT